jgi:hypothetical protein
VPTSLHADARPFLRCAVASDLAVGHSLREGLHSRDGEAARNDRYGRRRDWQLRGVQLVDHQCGATARAVTAGVTLGQQKSFGQAVDKILRTCATIDRGLQHMLRGGEQAVSRCGIKSVCDDARVHAIDEWTFADTLTAAGIDPVGRLAIRPAIPKAAVR